MRKAVFISIYLSCRPTVIGLIDRRALKLGLDRGAGDGRKEERTEKALSGSTRLL